MRKYDYLIHRPVGVVGFGRRGIVVQGLHIGDADAIGAARLVVHRVLTQPGVLLLELGHGDAMLFGKSGEVVNLTGGGDDGLGCYVGV